jgi:hypothetical protein
MIKLKDILNESSKPKSIHVTYIERSGKLYSIKVDGKKVDNLYMDDEFSVKMPPKYDEQFLNKMTRLFKQHWGIKFTYDDSMDVS